MIDVEAVLIDADGDEVSDERHAVGFVAGEGATWFAGLLSDYETVTRQ